MGEREVGEAERAAQAVAHFGPVLVLAEDDLDAAHRRADLLDAEALEERTEIAEQAVEEPGTVLPLERDFLIVRES